jgi:hypothetical protein
VAVSDTDSPPTRMSRRERLLWFVLPGLLLAGGGVLLLRIVEAHQPANQRERSVESIFGPVPGHLPPGAYHLDTAIGWTLVGVGAVLVSTGAAWHALSTRSG